MRNQHKLLPTTTSKNSTKQDHNPYLSGAYIRSLVKHLSSSSTTRSNHHPSTTMVDTKPPHGQHPQQQEAPQAPAPPSQPHKKQVRRRLHTSRPYQERLLNMAEARREIVTALKIHRASMRQAKEIQQQQQQQLMELQHQQEMIQVVQLEQSQAARDHCINAPMSFASSSSFPDYLYNSPFAHLAAASSSYSCPLPYHTPAAAVAPMADGGLDHHQLLPQLPTQPLGLNLSFHGFSDVVAAGGAAAADGARQYFSAGSFDPPPLLQPSPASSYSVYSSSSSPASVTMASHDMTSSTTTAAVTTLPAAADASLHRVLDDEEMAAIYAVGEQHDIEWSDTVNLVTSAWWSKILEVSGGDAAAALESTVGAAAEHTPADWFADQGTSAGSCSSDVLEMHLSERYHHAAGGYGGDEDVFALPRMDIGEIEGWDAGWFS